MMRVVETIDLWSGADQAALTRCQGAVAADDLVAALLEVEDAPRTSRQACRDQIELWGRAVGDLAASGAPEVQAAVLRHVLCSRAGLKGDPEHYYEPENCHLSRVVDLRRGMPILLTAVWIAVGTQAGIAVRGIGLPGHFIARVGDEPALLVDPFSNGRPLTVAHCAALVKRLTDGQLPWDNAFLDPTDTGALVLRVLRNLVNCHERSGEARLAYRAARFAAGLFPSQPAAALLHARAAERAGVEPLALSLYRDLVTRFGGSEEATEARGCADRLAEDVPTVH